MEQHSSQDPWGWLSIFSCGSRAFHASGGEPKCMQRWHNKKLTKRQGKAKKSRAAGRQRHKTAACPNWAGLLSVRISSPSVFSLTDSELQRHLANGKLSPGAEMEASLAASRHGDSALDWEYFTDTLSYFINIFFCHLLFWTNWLFAENEVTVATWGLGCGRATWRRHVCRWRKLCGRSQKGASRAVKPTAKSLSENLASFPLGNVCLHFSQQVAALFTLHLLPLFVLRGRKSLFWPFLQVSAP